MKPSTRTRSQGPAWDRNLVEGKFRIAAKLMHERPALRRRQDHPPRARLPQPEGVAAGMVDVEALMRVLDGRNGIAAPRELRHEPGCERRLARVLPTGNAEYRRHHLPPPSSASASAKSSGRLRLKKGSILRPADLDRGEENFFGLVLAHPRLDFAHAARERLLDVRRKRHRPKPEDRMNSLFRSGDQELGLTLFKMRVKPRHEISRKERRVGRRGDHEAAVRPIGDRPFETGVDAGKRPANGRSRDPRRSAGRKPRTGRVAIGVENELRTCGLRRPMTWASMGLPASGNRHLSPPPMRLDLPPASRTPTTASVKRSR